MYEDFDYLQNSIETEIYKIFKQVTTYNGAAAIIKGFTLGVSSSDSTKLMITHSGPFGSLVSKEGMPLVTGDDQYKSLFAQHLINYVLSHVLTLIHHILKLSNQIILIQEIYNQIANQYFA